MSLNGLFEDSDVPAGSGRVLGGLVDPNIGRMLDLARRHLQMDVSFISEFRDGKQIYREASGHADSFGIVLGDGPDLVSTYCQQMIDGALPNFIPDSAADPRVSALSTTVDRQIGSYLGVPLRLSDGSLYGTFCCMSQNAESLDARDAGFMAMLAEVLVEALDASQLAARDRGVIEGILDGGSLEPVFQPIINLGDGRVVGFEALSRFSVDAVKPEKVFELAHSVGLGVELEILALRLAAGFLPQIPDGAYLAMNLSPATALVLTDRLLGVSAGNLNRLVLEVTETTAVAGYDELKTRLEPLREQGVRVAIDDAGAGFASLHHIVELRPDVIKIDRSLIKGMAADSSRRSAVRAFIALAGDMGAATVAEGIESPADLNAARELGITCAQGYLLGRPAASLAAAAYPLDSLA